MPESIKCQSCTKDVSVEEVFISGGQTLCEECYIDAGSRIKSCDPWAERSKRIFRESHGLKGIDGLTDLQRDIYEYIRSEGKATGMELIEKFKLSPTEMENQFAILRHCQLLKGKREDDKVYVVLW